MVVFDCYPISRSMAESAQEVLKELTAAGLLSADHATEFGEEIKTKSIC